MHKAIEIGVAIPAYNAGYYIEECLESVLCQSHPAVQIVVCDDASTDDTVERVRKLQLQYPDQIELIAHPGNMGIPHNFNSGLNAIKTSYITFLAGDDIWHKDKLASEIPLLKGDVNCVYSHCGFIDQKGKYIGPMRRRFDGCSGNILFEMLMHQMSFRSALLNVGILREIGGFNEDLHIFEDWEMKIKYLQRANVAFCKEETVFYRQHPEGISKNSTGLTFYRNLAKVYINVDSIIRSLSAEEQRKVDQYRLVDLTRLLQKAELEDA